MFYFLLAPLLSYNLLLIAMAVIPAVFLMIQVYRSDRLEPESPAKLWGLVKAGILSSLIALVLEKILGAILNAAVTDETLYNVLLYFVVVAMSEEGAKYFMMKLGTWYSQEFNCQYDGVVYAAFTSLGFALWENISYVLHYGFGTAVVRAVTAIPGHLCFGVFMGVFYGAARRYENQGDTRSSQFCRICAVIIPALLHGAYDYIASMQSGNLYFLAFIAILFFVTFKQVQRSSRADTYI